MKDSGDIRVLSGRARLAGVFGWPVTHSKSPRLHGYWLAKYGIDGAYLPLATRPEHLQSAIRALPMLGFRGANVTLPHKERALDAVDELTPMARRIGAVNTLTVHDDGSILGDNSDGFGFLEHLKSSVPDWQAANGPAMILGAGGAARAILVALVDAGVPKIMLCNRTTRRAEELAKSIGGPIAVIGWEARATALAEAALLVNSTQLGMAGQPRLDLDLARLAQSSTVYDIVYTPLETPLLASARRRGLKTVDGIGMLLHQARPGFEAWFGTAPMVDAALRDFVLAG
jgi:shikimate dehydrogenase